MTGHTEFWGVFNRTEVVTVAICSRCAKAYNGVPFPFTIPAGDSLRITFPCCPDDGSNYIEWEIEEKVDA